jgi:hypothetical protein
MVIPYASSFEVKKKRRRRRRKCRLMASRGIVGFPTDFNANGNLMFAPLPVGSVATSITSETNCVPVALVRL